MKKFSKPFSWLLAFILMFTCIVSTDIPVYAVLDATTIGEDTDKVFVAGTELQTEYYGAIRMSYYESADSETVLYEDFNFGYVKLESNLGAIEPYAWHITFIEIEDNSSRTGGDYLYHFKAYPDTSLRDELKGKESILPEGTTLTTPGDETIDAEVYIEDTLLKSYSSESSFTLPSKQELKDLDVFQNIANNEDYNLPDLTKLYYTVVLEDNIDTYKLKLTLVPTVEVTFDENTGTPDLAGTTMYATPFESIDTTELPKVSLNDSDFYGWKRWDHDFWYAYFEKVTKENQDILNSRLSDPVKLTAMYQEKTPTYRIDLENKKITGLIPDRTYTYLIGPYTHDEGRTNENGELLYESLTHFDKYYSVSLTSDRVGIVVNSKYVSLKHNTPNTPAVQSTATTARVTNTNELAGCEFAIRATSDGSALNWGISSKFTELTPETQYKIYVRHKADENGFQSNEAESSAFTTSATKAVSNEAPNGVTIASISDQTHTGKAVEPTLVIKDDGITLVQGTDYTVAYSNNINVGTATSTVTFAGTYIGTMTKNFTIIKKKSSGGGGGSTSKSSESTTPTVAVTLNTDGVDTAEIKNIAKGSTVGEIPAPTKEGYVFAGWYADKELTQPYDANTKLPAATTLYANWTKVEQPTDHSNNELVLTIGNKEAKVFGSGKTNDVAPIIRNNRTMLPARYVAENLGAEVTWNAEKKEVTIKGKNEKGEDVTIQIYINSDIAFVNGKEEKLDSPAFIGSDRTYTPIRFIAEKLGATVDWVESEQKVVITKK